jgi:OOP family OmpA-OmpF porin
VLIEGHTDSTAPDAYNLALSQRRANAVEDFLIIQGVDQTGISAAGYVRQEPQARHMPWRRAPSRAGRNLPVCM